MSDEEDKRDERTEDEAPAAEEAPQEAEPSAEDEPADAVFDALAAGAGLVRLADIAMPANNRCVIWATSR